MLEPQVTRLLESAINTSCKLAIVLQFVEYGALKATSLELASRVCRDVWSVEAALKELVENGVLCRRDNRYTCEPATDLRADLDRLQETYAHPLLRNELHRVLRDLERYAPYRNELPHRFWDTIAA